MDRYRNLLTSERLATADLANGASLAAKHCLNCHRLMGQGKEIGPDLTGAQRYDLGYLLGNVFDPSAEIDRDFQMSVVSLGTDVF